MAKNKIQDYTVTASLNTDVSGIDIGEGCAPSGLNDAMREFMSHMAEYYKDRNGSLVSGGSGGAYTLTTNDEISSYVQGQLYVFEANHAMPDTATCTININATGAKAVRKYFNQVPQENDIKQNGLVEIGYEATSDVWQMLSNVHVGQMEQGKHSIWIPASAMTPTDTAGCAGIDKALGVVAYSDYWFLGFDTASDEHATFQIAMPDIWDKGTVTFVPFWSHSSGTGTVAWALKGNAITNDEPLSTNGTAQISTDTGGTANDMYVGPESAAITINGTPADDDLIHFTLYRDVSGDTLTADAELIGIKLYFTVNTGHE